MHPVYSLEALLCLIPCILCLLTGLILLIFSSADSKFSLILAGIHFSLGTFFGLVFLNYSHLVELVPHMYRTGNLCWLLYMPLPFLYMRSVDRRRLLTWIDLIHLIPAVVFIIDYCPFFLTASDIKLIIIRSDQRNPYGWIAFSEGWFMPANFYVRARTIITAFYWVLQAGLLVKMLKGAPGPGKLLKRWLLLFTFLQLPLFAPALFTILTKKTFIWTTSIPPAAGTILSCITLFMCPQILYGRLRRQSKEQKAPEKQETAEKPKTVIDAPLIEQIGGQLEKLMTEYKPFLNSNYTLKEMARDMGVSPHQLSAYINQVTGKNFNDFLNGRRICYCLNLIAQGEAESLNLHGLAQRCGFNNRNTFAIAFKKNTGTTPSDYLRNKA